MRGTVEQVVERYSILEHPQGLTGPEVRAREAEAGPDHIVEETVWRWTVEDDTTGYVHNGTAATEDEAAADARAWAAQRAVDNAARVLAETEAAAKVKTIDLGV